MNENISDMVNKVLDETLTQATSNVVYTNSDDYKEKTGRRFRMTKAELEQYGSSPEGRQKAFESRRDSGKL